LPKRSCAGATSSWAPAAPPLVSAISKTPTRSALPVALDVTDTYLSDLHYFGPAALTKAAPPHMRRQESGWVVQFSSVGGQFTAPGFGAYLSSPMPEYAETVGPTRAYVQTGGGSQPGDPVKAARAILGGDAIDRIRQRLGHLQDELTEWEELGRDTALDE
jgi:hypothetical protein